VIARTSITLFMFAVPRRSATRFMFSTRGRYDPPLVLSVTSGSSCIGDHLRRSNAQSLLPLAQVTRKPTLRA